MQFAGGRLPNRCKLRERAKRRLRQMRRGEREAAVERIEDQRKPDDFSGTAAEADGKTACRFQHLTPACRCRITCDGDENLMLTVTDGRKIRFWGSMKNVPEELCIMISDA